MGVAGTLEVDLILDAANFMANMKRAADKSVETSNQIRESFERVKVAAEGLAAALALDAVKDCIERALEYASTLDEVSQQLGVTATDLQTFRYAGSQVGISTEEMDKALGKFTKTLGQARAGVSSAKGVFEQLGFTDQQIKNLSEHDILLKAADGIGKIGDSALRSAPEVALFGRAGQKLDTLLSGGSASINALAKSAEDLGIVLSRDEIENADKTADKISELKQVLGADIAKAVADNASSIYDFVSAIERLVTKIPDAIDSIKRFRLNLSEGLAENVLRADYLLGSPATRDADRARIAGIQDQRRGIDAAYAQRHPASFAQSSLSALDQITTHGGHYTDPGAARAAASARDKAAREAARLAKEAAEQQSGFDKARASGLSELWGLRGSLTSDPGFQAMFERNQLNQEWGHRDDDTGRWIGGSRDKQVDDELAAGKYGAAGSALAQARAEQLKRQNDINGELKYELSNRKLDDALDQQQLALQTSGLDLQKEHLQAQEGLARTSAERRKIADDIIDIEFRQRQLALEAELAAKKRNRASPEDIALTQGQLDGLGQQRSDAHAANAHQNQGPLAQYLDGIPRTVAEINESLEQAATEGLGHFQDGLLSVIEGTGNLGDAFRSLTRDILDGIAKIALQEAIIKPLGSLLGGGGGGGILGKIAGFGAGLLGGGLGGIGAGTSSALSAANSSLSLGALGISGWRANGGMTQPGDYVVGERGPEIVSIGAASNVVNHAQLKGLQSGNGQITINSTVNAVNDPAQVRALAAQTMMQAAPSLLKMGSDQTTKDLGRPRMR